MFKVSIANLKNNLSSYIHKVSKGGEVIITDRHRPVAKIVSLEATPSKNIDEMLAQLCKEGCVEVDFSYKNKKNNFKKIQLPSGWLASELIIKDRNK